MGWFDERFVTVHFEKVDLKPRFYFSNAAGEGRAGEVTFFWWRCEARFHWRKWSS